MSYLQIYLPANSYMWRERRITHINCATFYFLFGIVWLFKIGSLLRLWHLSMYQLNNDVWALIAWENVEFPLSSILALPAPTIHYLEMICQNCIFWKKYIIIINLSLKYNFKYFLKYLERLWNVFQQYREMLILKVQLFQSHKGWPFN